MEKTAKYDLEDRLVSFTVLIMEVVEMLPETRAGNHIAGQLVRCGSSPTLNYSEAQSSSSRSDFINRMNICLRELRETRVCLKIILKKPLIKNSPQLNIASDECNQLISIFVKSIETAKNNRMVTKAKQSFNLDTTNTPEIQI